MPEPSTGRTDPTQENRPIREALTRLGLSLPAVATTYGAYAPVKRVGTLIFVAGQLPVRDGVLVAAGRVGSPGGPTIEQARDAARQCVINALAALDTTDIGLDGVTGVARMGVFVACDETFADHPRIADAASELLTHLLGDAGRGTRAAVGVASLPKGATVEIEFVFVAG